MTAHLIGRLVAGVGAIIIVVGVVRIVRAPVVAARRTAGDTPTTADGGRYVRGLTDFYRISGAVGVVAGLVLLLIPMFAASP